MGAGALILSIYRGGRGIASADVEMQALRGWHVPAMHLSKIGIWIIYIPLRGSNWVLLRMVGK